MHLATAVRRSGHTCDEEEVRAPTLTMACFLHPAAISDDGYLLSGKAQGSSRCEGWPVFPFIDMVHFNWGFAASVEAKNMRVVPSEPELINVWSNVTRNFPDLYEATKGSYMWL